MTKISAEVDSSSEIFRIGSPTNPLVISFNKFKGQRYLDIRRYFYDAESKTTKPTPKGISLKEDEFAVLASFFVEKLDELNESFTRALEPEEFTKRSSRQEKLARSKHTLTHSKVELEFDSWSGPHFFKCIHRSDGLVMLLNKRNLIINRFSDGELSPKEVVWKILVSYVKASNELSVSSKMKPAELLEFLEISWGNALR